MEKWGGGGGRKGKTERQGRGVIALTICEKAIRNYITLWLLKINICIHTHTHNILFIHILTSTNRDII